MEIGRFAIVSPPLGRGLGGNVRWSS